MSAAFDCSPHAFSDISTAGVWSCRPAWAAGEDGHCPWMFSLGVRAAGAGVGPHASCWLLLHVILLRPTSLPTMQTGVTPPMG